MFRLYTTPLSANGRKVLAVARQLGIEPEVRLVNVYRGEGRAPEYLAVNPTGRIPTLVDGELTLTESNAILVYLSEAHGDLRLFGGDPKGRARILRWLFWESAHWQPALIRVLAPLVGHALRPDVVPAPAEPPDWEDAELQPLLLQLDARLAGRPFLVGATPSLADFCVAGMTTYFRRADFPFDAYPRFAAWCGRVAALEGWRATETDPWR